MLSLRTQSFHRYRIRGGVPSPGGQAFHEKLHEKRFLPLAAGEERTYGWVTADNLLVTDFHIGTVMQGEYAAFALRVDRRRVNARLLRAQIDLEVQARLQAAREAGGAARLGRDERRTLREELRGELLRQTNPSVDAYTVLVHPRRKLVHVLSLARTANELVRLHLRDTFDVDLVPLSPWQRSVELLESGPLADANLRAGLDELRRADFQSARSSEAAGAAGRLPGMPATEAVRGHEA